MTDLLSFRILSSLSLIPPQSPPHSNDQIINHTIISQFFSSDPKATPLPILNSIKVTLSLPSSLPKINISSLGSATAPLASKAMPKLKPFIPFVQPILSIDLPTLLLLSSSYLNQLPYHA